MKTTKSNHSLPLAISHMEFHLRDHTADIAVESCASTIEEAFVGIAEGLSKAHSPNSTHGTKKFGIEISSESLEALLFDFLDMLISERDIHNVLPIDHEVSINQEKDIWTLVGTYYGIPLETIESREIKAVTYSDMKIEKNQNGWKLYVVFDV